MNNDQTDITEAEISELIEAIKDATSAGKAVTKSAVDRLHRCIDAGGILVKLKTRMKHGRWTKWCEEIRGKIEGFNVTIRTLQKWMRIHEKVESGKIDVNTTKGLRHAYQLADIVPESDDPKAGKHDEEQPLYIVHLLRFCACIERLNPNAMTATERALLRQRLDPINRLYLSLV